MLVFFLFRWYFLKSAREVKRIEALGVCVFVCLCVYLSIYPSVYLYVCLYKTLLPVLLQKKNSFYISLFSLKLVVLSILIFPWHFKVYLQ